jgi:hypothetical protein
MVVGHKIWESFSEILPEITSAELKLSKYCVRSVKCTQSQIYTKKHLFVELDLKGSCEIIKDNFLFENRTKNREMRVKPYMYVHEESKSNIPSCALIGRQVRATLHDTRATWCTCCVHPPAAQQVMSYTFGPLFTSGPWTEKCKMIILFFGNSHLLLVCRSIVISAQNKDIILTKNQWIPHSYCYNSIFNQRALAWSLKRQGRCLRLSAEQITIRLPAPPMTNGINYEKTFALKLCGSHTTRIIISIQLQIKYIWLIKHDFEIFSSCVARHAGYHYAIFRL